MNKRNEILAALRADPNATQVGRRLGVSRRTAAAIAKRAGIVLPEGKPLPPEKRAAVCALLRENPCAKAVASNFGLSQVCVSKIARQEGISLRRGRPPISDACRALVWSFYETTASVSCAGEKAGISRGAVLTIIAAAQKKVSSFHL